MRRVRGDKELFKKLLLNFTEKYGDISERLKQALLSGDVNGMRTMTHELKGISGNISAGSLHRSATSLWKYLSKSGTDLKTGVEQEIGKIETAMNQVLRSAAGVGKIRQDEPNEEDTAPETLRAGMVELRQSLATRKTESEDLLLSIKKRLLMFDVKDEYKKLESQIERFDYKTAMETLMRISEKTGIPLQEE